MMRIRCKGDEILQLDAVYIEHFQFFDDITADIIKSDTNEIPLESIEKGDLEYLKQLILLGHCLCTDVKRSIRLLNIANFLCAEKAIEILRCHLVQLLSSMNSEDHDSLLKDI